MEHVIDTLVVELKARIDGFRQAMDDAVRELNGFGARAQDAVSRIDLGKIGKGLKKAGREMMPLSAPLMALGITSEQAAMKFQAAMNSIKAITQSSDEEMAKLKATALDLSQNGLYKPLELADAMEGLARAGYHANEIMAVLPATTTLAAATQLDLGEAARALINIMSDYQITTDQLAHVNDVLVRSVDSGVVTMQDLASSYRYAGAIAQATGLSFEQVTAAFVEMSHGGIRASMAGTSLRGAIDHLLNPSKAAAEKMKELGIAATDANGRLLPLDQIIRQLEPHADDAGLMLELFGQRAGPAMALLVKQGSASLQEMTIRLQEAQGWAERVAGTRTQGALGAHKQFAAAFQGAEIAVGDSGLLEGATAALKAFTQALQEFQKIDPETRKSIVEIAVSLAAVGPALLALGTALTALANPFIRVGGLLITGIAAIKELNRQAHNAYPELSKLNDTIILILTHPVTAYNAYVFRPLTDGIKKATAEAAQTVADVFGGLQEQVAKKLDVIKQHLQKWVEDWPDFRSKLATFGRNWASISDVLLSDAIFDRLDRLVTSMSNFAGEFLPKFADAINERVDTVRDAIKHLGEAFGFDTSLVDKLADAIKNGVDSALKFVQTAVEQMIAAIKGLFAYFEHVFDDSVTMKDHMGNFITEVNSLGQSVRYNAQHNVAILDLTETATNVEKNAAEIKQNLKDIGQGARDLNGEIFNMQSGVKSSLESATGGFAQMHDKVVGHSYVPDMISRIGEEFDLLNKLMVDPTAKATDEVIRRFREVYMEMVGASIVPDLVEETGAWFDKMADRVVTATDLTTSAVKGAFKSMASETSRVFEDFVTGTKSGSKSLVDAILGDLQRLATRTFITPVLSKISDSIFGSILNGVGSLFGLGGGSSFSAGAGGTLVADSSLLSAIGSLPGRAAGGPVVPGSAYLVGEKGPEIFRPQTAGTIIPNGRTAGVTVNIYAQDAKSVMQSETQIAAMLARVSARGQRNL